MGGILVTNNPLVYQNFKEGIETIYIKGAGYLQILLAVRNKIHDGHILLTHPLSGSIKPNETYYKSIMLSKKKAELDIDSLKMIEDSITTADQLIKDKKPPKWTKAILEDFQLIDFDLIKSGVESMKQF